jgi:hypothetical protein
MATHHHEMSKEESERVSLALKATIDKWIGLPARDRWEFYQQCCATVGCTPLSYYPLPDPEVPTGFVLWPRALQLHWRSWARWHYGLPGFNVPCDLNNQGEEGID